MFRGNIHFNWLHIIGITMKLFFKFVLSLYILSTFCEAKNYKYQLAICTIFQNDARFLKEWIEYHKLIGVEHFYLYNNKSEDDYLSVIQPYVDNGEVELIQWDGDEYPHWNDVQENAYLHAIKKTKNVAKWLAIIDTDEFILPVKENNLVTFLKAYEKYPALVINWQCYGTSNVKKIPDDKLMIETLLYRAESDHYDNYFIKSIVRPNMTRSSKGKVHDFYYYDKKHAVNADKQVVKVFRTKKVSVDKIRINHYRTRDEEHFNHVKLPRLKEWYKTDSKRWTFDDHNNVYDDLILRFVPSLREKIFNH